MVSESSDQESLTFGGGGLNPCFSGGWSRRLKKSKIMATKNFVLILVLVEDGLGEGRRREYTSVCGPVLILVLVEDGLGVSF